MDNIFNEYLQCSSGQLFLTTIDKFLQKALPKKCCKKYYFVDNPLTSA